MINTLYNIGIREGMKLSDQKKIRLVNLIVITWYGVIIFSMVRDYFYEVNFWEGVKVFATTTILLISIQVFLHFGKQNIAKGILMTCILSSTFIFANFIEPNRFMEFFYLLGMCFCLMIFDNKWVQYGLLLLISFLMIFPPLYLDLYSEPISIGPLDMPISMCWVLFYLIVIYFKNNNLNNEKLLLEQKKIVDEQKKKLEELNQFQKQFFVNVAHEIRTPLTLINGNANRLADSPESQKIKQQSSKIQNIVDDVLDLAKLETDNFKLNKKDSSITSLANKLVTSFDSAFEEKCIKLSYDNTTFANVIVNMDLVFIERAINNLFTNALKYTEEKGSVSVVITQTNNHVSIAITDTGIGMHSHELDKIFDRFYQSENTINKAGGSGIGLAFTKEIISLHGGTIEVESKVGHGSTFLIKMPYIKIVEEENEVVVSPKIENIQTKVVAPTSSKKKILLVEDNKDMRAFIKSILINYEVIEAVDGLKGIEQITKQSFDFVITDYMMPNMNGYDFVKQLKALQYNVPILMLTAKSDDTTKMESLRIGIDDFMAKPFHEEELLIRINNAIKNNASREEYINTEKIEKVEEKGEVPFLTQVTNYIYVSCAEPNFGIDEICLEFGLSVSSLYRKMKSLTGLSTKALIIEVRLKKAYELSLQNPDYDVKELAIQVGYTNYNYFNKLYKERFGVSITDQSK